MTSSCAAATPGPGAGDGTYDETVWSDPANPKLDTYRISKAVAERAAWDFMTEHGGSTEFATVLPGAVFGPIRSRDGLGSVQVIGRMLAGMPGVPRVGLNIVDVRDLADLHLRAMTDDDAVGERFIGVGGFMWMSEVAAELRARLGADARRVPTRTLPDLGVRLFARVRPELGGLVPMLGRRYSHSNAKARTRLGWEPRPPATTVVDCARSLIDAGVV
jgi:nucleoside-diphosphate-sugar epimerase